MSGQTTDIRLLAQQIAVLTEKVEAQSTAIAQGLNVPSGGAIDIDTIADRVVARLLTADNPGGLPNDMGVPAEFRLNEGLQNYFIWSVRNGVAWALQSPQNLLYMATIFDAMAGASDSISRVNAAQTALANVKKTLG